MIQRGVAMEQILNMYYENNAKKLHNLVDKILSKFGGLSNKDTDDFYSLANEVFSDVIVRYDGKQSFDGFLYACLVNKIKSEITRRNRQKRQADRMAISIDTPIDGTGDNSTTLRDIIPDNSFDMDLELENSTDTYQDEKIEKYLSSLPKTQRQIVEMKMNDIPNPQIKSKLNLTDKQYSKLVEELKSFNNVRTIRTLFKNPSKFKEKEEEIIMTTVTTTQTAEKSKPMQYSIASIIKKIEDCTIRFNHPLQRESDQWSPSMKGNLISDILQGNPLPEIVFAEQIINGIPVIWDLDGKQRCTNCYSFANDGFKISRNIRRWNIKYLAQIKENGKPKLDEGGFPMSEYKEFDIRNKKFSQLPAELQEKFLDYTFKCDQYLNCDSEEIAYHIIRYNEGKAMSKSQKGITRIGEEFAQLIKSISAMPFFHNYERGGYKLSEAKNGTLERVVVESVMASKYLDEWNKQQEIICEYLKENAKSEDFDDFEDMVTRLDAVMTDDVAKMFDSKDSFLWFSLFARFNNTGEEDKKFIEFMAEFSRSLHSKEVNGITYDELCIDKKSGNTRATKDKYIVVPKIELMEKLMLEYLGIDKVESDNETEITAKDIIEEFVDNNITDDDIELYELMTNDKSEVIEDIDSWILSDENRQSLVALVGYAAKNEIEDELDDWLPYYEKNNMLNSLNAKQKYLHMVEDFDNYCRKVGAA